MKKITYFVAVAISALLFSFKTIAPTTWTVDPVHSKLSFTVTHAMVTDVQGIFKNYSATIVAPGEDFAGATFDFSADAGSIDMDNEGRTTHVKSDAFLDVTKFPKLTFKSRSITKSGGNNYKITGDLTLHGVTKPVSLNALIRTGVDQNQKPVAGIKFTGVIKRADFGIGSSIPNAIVSDEITIAANGEFDKN